MTDSQTVVIHANEKSTNAGSPGTDCDLEAFIIRVGSEPEKVSVAGPEQP